MGDSRPSPARALPLHERDVNLFEERFINTLDYSLSDNIVKLVGSKTVRVPSHELHDLNNHYDSNPHEWTKMSNCFFDHASDTLRVYFPVKGTLVAHDRKHHEANSLGELNLQQVNGDYAVLDSKPTRYRGGRQHHSRWHHLSRQCALPLAQYGRVFVCYFGEKVILDHDHSPEKRGDKKSCIKNHGGPNCSNKFKIHSNKCKKRNDIYMDYNGRFSTGKKTGATWRNFRGSDCAKALA